MSIVGKGTIEHGGRMTRSASVLTKITNNDKTMLVTFQSIDHDAPAKDRGRSRYCSIERADWEDMGSPETITVTVEPGDTLNEEER